MNENIRALIDVDFLGTDISFTAKRYGKIYEVLVIDMINNELTVCVDPEIERQDTFPFNECELIITQKIVYNNKK